ncbi:tryptophan synthase subunit alpha [Limnochorda sp.]|mgnify:CR=1 FL=1|uniref:tryptophan synthase subunit alpha n=1 Tax=Limnochorda sp. TaxID=1940279 RepID=UPI00181524C1|nr:tryptophan synthase subunit alpha [Bacillota bacterium]MBO2518876.1 tryptophan synthase subunit alpha [Bacillota bacterium]NMA71545.1 tryptophan synthase subunit alpha [Bacillota bacterium]
MSKDRIVRSFAAARAQGRAAFMPYVTLGYPSPAACLEVIEGLVEGGADLLELGIPFSDPLADGPVLQAAAQAALQAGTTWPRALDLLARVRALAPELPLVLLVYANTVHARGVERFAGEAAEAGADGVILPDWPPDEGGGLREALARAGLAAVGLVSPVSPVGRIAQIAAASQGFLYAVSVTGVTGERPRLSRELEPLVQRIRRASSLPVAAGFGISRPEDAAAAGRLCDGVIVGSALARRIAEAQGQNLGRLARQVAAAFREALEGGPRLAADGAGVPG